jgi:ComF family protein
MNEVKNIVHSFSHLFFPHTCAGCGNDLIAQEQLLCLQCISQLPFTGFEFHSENPIEKIFYGRVSIKKAMSLLYFTKDSSMQNLLHEFKYKGKKEIGYYFGRMMGKAIINSERFYDIDALVPLPLFASKEKRRGYNQSAIICNGITEILNIPVLNNAVIRTTSTETQTHKNRIERWQNIEGKFELIDPSSLTDKHILLIDDVLTTGATIEACVAALLQAPNAKVSIATLACASL